MADTLVEAQQGADLRRQPVSPAAHLAGAFAVAAVTGRRAVSIRERPLRSMIGVRTETGTEAATRIEAVLGVGLPDRCGVVTTGAGTSVLWFGPDEFLAVDGPAHLTEALVEALGADRGAVVDLSANRTTVELTGPSARAVLEKGCPLDLHPRAFPVGAGYLTTVGPVPVVLRRTGEQAWELMPRSSFADFLGRWLLDAMTEFQGPVIP